MKGKFIINKPSDNIIITAGSGPNQYIEVTEGIYLGN